jgi:membrane fusion protein (multidrug efflux system)
MSTVIDDEKLEGKVEPQPDEEQKPLQKGVLIDEHGAPIPPVETERQTRKRPLYRRPAFLIAAVIVILVSALLGTRYWLYARSHESTDDAFIDAHIIQVSPKVSGYVVKLDVDSNQQVNKGDLIAEIDPRDFQARLDQAKAALAAGEARLKEARTGVDLTRANTRANVQQATGTVQQARAGVTVSRAQAAAERSRVGQAGATVLTAQANFQQAQAQVNAAQAEVARAES